jgi:hypothetical protein
MNADDEDFLTPPDAVKLVRDASVVTEAPRDVESAVWRRIAGYVLRASGGHTSIHGRTTRYPAAARQHVHTTKAWLPADIARALSADPALVQKPVETFYTRDAIQLRVRPAPRPRPRAVR